METTPILLIWGTGIVAQKLLQNELNGNIKGFIESKKSKAFFMDKPVYTPEEIMNFLDSIDYILVANTYGEEIYRTCLAYHIELSKVIFLDKIRMQIGFSEQDCIKQLLGEKNYTEYCYNHGLYNNSFFQEDMKKYEQQMFAYADTRSNFQIDKQNLYPIINEKYSAAGSVHNYFWQDLWAARLIIRSGVKEHFDIGSRLDGFIAHLLAADIDVTMIDVREFPNEVEKLHTIVDDATLLKQIPDNSIESMSALCSLEHFGLGRYGDAVDPEACFKCFEQIQRKLKQGGKLYISVPIGKERVEFNAHRVFYAKTIADAFALLELKEFSTTAAGLIEYNADLEEYDYDDHHGDYRYGLFYFIKK